MTAPGWARPLAAVLVLLALGSELGAAQLVEGDGTSAKIAFLPDPDGFQQQNTPSTLTWEMFKRFFGAKQVENTDGSRIRAAKDFFDSCYAGAGAEGSDFGFAAVSLLNHYKADLASWGSFAMAQRPQLFLAHDLWTRHFNPQDLSEGWSYGQGLPLGRIVEREHSNACSETAKSPGAMFRDVRSSLAGGVPGIMSLFWIDAGEFRSLTLVPFRCGESGETGVIHVYDSNHPGDNDRVLAIDLARDTWSYETGTGMAAGDGSICSLRFVPIGLLLGKGVPPWKTGLGAGATAERTVVATGPVRILFTDQEGRKHGFDEEAYGEEIPGLVTGAAIRNRGVSSYFVPSGLDLGVALRVRGTNGGEAAVRTFSDGFGSLVAVSETSEFDARLEYRQDGMSVGSFNGAAAGRLGLSRLSAAGDHSVFFGDLDFSADNRYRLSLEETPSGTRIVLDREGGSPGEVSVSLEGGGDAFASFPGARFTLPGGCTLVITVPEWTADALGSIEAGFDTDRDGIVDYSGSMEPGAELLSGKLEVSPGELALGERGIAWGTVTSVNGSRVPDGTPIAIEVNGGDLVFSQETTTVGKAGGLLKAGYRERDMQVRMLDTEGSLLDEETIPVRMLIYPPDGGSFANGTMSFKWTRVPEATSYQLQLADNPAFTQPLLRRSLASTRLVPAVSYASGKTYYWRVRPWYGTTRGKWSRVRGFSIR